VKIGVGLRVRYEAMVPLVQLADELGFESVWLPEHLVFPVSVGQRSPFPGETHPPMDPSIPTYDNLMFLAALGLATQEVKLGTWVYNLALRHPIVAARSVQTLDVLSQGRAILGIGAGWIPGEYAAVGVDFETRGARLDESIDVLRHLWSEDEPEWHGRFFDFEPLKFEPKPPQGMVPIHVGGESTAALRRAATRGDGWIGMGHEPDTAAEQVRRLRGFAEAAGRDPATIEVTVGATPRDHDELEAYVAAGVDRIIVSPWERTAGALDGLREYARDLRDSVLAGSP